MTEEYIPFKRGCVYNPLYSFMRIDPVGILNLK